VQARVIVLRNWTRQVLGRRGPERGEAICLIADARRSVPLPSLPLACLRMKMMHSDVMGSARILLPKRARSQAEGPTDFARTREWPTLCAPPLLRCYYPSPFERPPCEIINLAYLQKPPLRGIIWEVHYFTGDAYKGKFSDSAHLICAPTGLLIFWRSIIRCSPRKKGARKKSIV